MGDNNEKIIILLTILGLSVSCVGCASNNKAKSSPYASSSGGSITQKDSSSNSSDSNEIKYEYNVGDVIKLKGEEVTVTNVKKNYKPSSAYSKPKNGNQFVKVTITIKNISEDNISISPFEFTLLNSKGVLENIDGGTYALLDRLESTKLVKGKTKSGSLVFQAPKDDANLKLVYKPSLWKNAEVKIRL